MSDPNAILSQDPYLWFTSVSSDPTAEEPTVDAIGFNIDPAWLFAWWNQSSNNVFNCVNSTPGALVWERIVMFGANRVYTPVTLNFGATRVPNTNKETIVIASISMTNTLSTSSTITVQVDNGGNGVFNTIATLEMSGIAASTTQPVTFNVPVRSQYQIIQTGNGNNSIVSINEIPL